MRTRSGIAFGLAALMGAAPALGEGRNGVPPIAAMGQLGEAPLRTAMKVSIVDKPPLDGTNRCYAANRAPLAPNPLIKLPIGAVRPEGWLRGQLELMTEGMTGHLAELSQFCRFEDNGWTKADGSGTHGWEELPYWLKGLGDLGYVLKDERIIAEARRWLDAALETQREDGYFGPKPNREHNDLWPNMVMVNALQSLYEATGDARVIPFMTRYFRWELSQGEAILPDSWQQVRAGDNLQSVIWLYNRTGEPWLLDLARLIHKHTLDWSAGIEGRHRHGVNICQSFREPGQFYQVTGDSASLAETERAYRLVMDTYGQAPGGMFGADENCRDGYTDPRQGAETCSMVEFMASFEMLLGITGDPLYADRCEEVAFNSLPAAMTKDLKALHYLTAPNMVQLDQASKSPGVQNGGCMLAYSPDERYRCCQHNVAQGWPYFAEHLWMATRDNGLAAVLYAANTVTAHVGEPPVRPSGTPRSAGEQDATVTIKETTDYPFNEEIRLEFVTDKPVQFPLYLRIPAWCEHATVELNGKALDAAPKPRAYVALDRTWRQGDVLRLVMPMAVRVRTWAANHDGVTVDRGPLTYSLRIGERWERFGENQAWPNWEAYPTTPWNYGLIAASDPKSFEVVKGSGRLARQPWDVAAVPIQIKAKGRKIPNWKLEGGLVGLLQQSPVRSTEPVEDITLIPMGCARLRVSVFPTVTDSGDAREWQPFYAPFEASHVFDTLDALSDNAEPKNSNDHSIPRFTWWDHLGTQEWVQANFRGPRRVSRVEVYWFDDTGVGQCRVPKSWQVAYRENGDWKPVAGASAYGLKPDQYNAVTFNPVATDGLRIEVQLQDGFSGGILEWRI